MRLTHDEKMMILRDASNIILKHMKTSSYCDKCSYADRGTIEYYSCDFYVEGCAMESFAHMFDKFVDTLEEFDG